MRGSCLHSSSVLLSILKRGPKERSLSTAPEDFVPSVFIWCSIGCFSYFSFVCLFPDPPFCCCDRSQDAVLLSGLIKLKTLLGVNGKFIKFVKEHGMMNSFTEVMWNLFHFSPKTDQTFAIQTLQLFSYPKSWRETADASTDTGTCSCALHLRPGLVPQLCFYFLRLKSQSSTLKRLESIWSKSNVFRNCWTQQSRSGPRQPQNKDVNSKGVWRSPQDRMWH